MLWEISVVCVHHMHLSMLRPVSSESLGLTAANSKQFLISGKQSNGSRGQKYHPSELWQPLARYPNQSFFSPGFNSILAAQ